MKQSKETVAYRQNLVLKCLQKDGIIYVENLCRELKVSPVTIRRDLAELEERKIIERFHGGARLLRSFPSTEDLYVNRLSVHSDQKKKIAEKAADLICDGDTIFLSSSSTALQILHYLGTKQIRIVTNNTLIASLKHSSNIEVILTGGEHSFERQSLYGEYASYVISKIRATKCILGVNGIDAEHGLTTTHYFESPINQQMLNQCSGQKIIVADGSKIGYCEGFVYCDTNQIDTLITDDSANAEKLAEITATGVEVITV